MSPGPTPQAVVTIASLGRPRGLTRALLRRDTDIPPVEIDLAVAALVEAGVLVERDDAVLKPSTALARLWDINLIGV